MRKLGSGLNSAVSNYNSFIGSFETRVLSTGRKFRDLDIETGGKEIEAMEPLDVLARDAQADETRALEQEQLTEASVKTVRAIAQDPETLSALVDLLQRLMQDQRTRDDTVALLAARRPWLRPARGDARGRLAKGVRRALPLPRSRGGHRLAHLSRSCQAGRDQQRRYPCWAQTLD